MNAFAKGWFSSRGATDEKLEWDARSVWMDWMERSLSKYPGLFDLRIGIGSERAYSRSFY
jgi:hypothetical protein